MREIKFKYLGKLINLTVFNFDWADIKMSLEISHDKYDNSETYAVWVIKSLEDISSDELKSKIGSTRRFKAQSLFMNAANRSRIQELVHLVDYINYGPSECDLLADDEYGVEIDNMVRRIEDGENG